MTIKNEISGRYRIEIYRCDDHGIYEWVRFSDVNNPAVEYFSLNDAVAELANLRSKRSVAKAWENPKVIQETQF